MLTLLLSSFFLTSPLCTGLHWHDLVDGQDRAKVEYLLQTPPKNLRKNFKYLRDRFYRVSSQPLEGVCNVEKRLGGLWTARGFVDGQKVVCMDHLLRDLEAGNCLVYSFGIADDWSFEDTMAALGCTVRAFDPTIDAQEKRSENVTFHKVGIAFQDGKIHMNGQLVPVKSLATLREELGDEDKHISYLKLDVEGYEIQSIPRWADEGDLKTVGQMGVEMHVDAEWFASDIETYSSLLKAFKKLFKQKMKLVSYEPNGIQEKTQEPDKMYHNYFDLLFVKDL